MTEALSTMARRTLTVVQSKAQDAASGVSAVRPRTRGECEGGPRPCPWVSCRYHLYLDVNPRTGAIKVNFPDLDPDELTESCVLDLVEEHGEVPVAIAARALGISRSVYEELLEDVLSRPSLREEIEEVLEEEDCDDGRLSKAHAETLLKLAHEFGAEDAARMADVPLATVRALMAREVERLLLEEGREPDEAAQDIGAHLAELEIDACTPQDPDPDLRALDELPTSKPVARDPNNPPRRGSR